MLYLDTHIAAELWDGDTTRFSKQARKEIEASNDLRISPMVLFELELLHEIGRLRPEASVLAHDLGKDLGVRVCTAAFEGVARHALKEAWTRDPFDRLIVAHARSHKAKLITRDGRIQQNYPQALG